MRKDFRLNKSRFIGNDFPMKNSSDVSWQGITEHLLQAALPNSMRALLGYVGLQHIIAIVESYGGTRLYVPIHPQPGEGLGALIGMDAAKAIASIYGGDVLEVPNLTKVQQRAKHAAVLDSVARGASQRDTARAFGITVRQVRNICTANLMRGR